MGIENYADFTAQSFMEDEAFRDWVRHPNADADAFWQEVITHYPKQKAEIDTAKAMLMATYWYYQQEIDEQQIADSLDKVRKAAEKKLVAPLRSIVTWYKWVGIAASITLVLGLSIYVLFFSQQPQSRSYATDFAQQKMLTLPDGSQVTLNAKSSLSFKNNWKSKQLREVWLDGEAFFDVSKATGKSLKFLVHTPGLDISVLGTQFNVNTKLLQTRVALQEGRIQLSYQHQQSIRTLNMIPGQIVSYHQQTQTLTPLLQEKIQTYTSWKDGSLIFESVSLGSVIHRLEEIYQVKWVIDNPALGKLPIRASLPVNDLNECLDILELLLLSEGAQLVRKDNLIQIESS